MNTSLWNEEENRNKTNEEKQTRFICQFKSCKSALFPTKSKNWLLRRSKNTCISSDDSAGSRENHALHNLHFCRTQSFDKRSINSHRLCLFVEKYVDWTSNESTLIFVSFKTAYEGSWILRIRRFFAPAEEF